MNNLTIEQIKDYNVPMPALIGISHLYERIGKLIWKDAHEDVIEFLERPFLELLKQRGVNFEEKDI